DMQQRERNRVMGKFRAGDTRILVATDVVGRGIDVTTVSHIINFDVPSDSDDYVHRVGRTGRMGREGVAFTFVTTEEGAELTKIEMRIDKLLIRDQIDGFDPTLAVDTPNAVAKPRPTEPPPKPLHGRDRGPGRHRKRL
ncbi:MAG: C-terminal helicase domain-containing protein, partial [Planctomycetota bacterium]